MRWQDSSTNDHEKRYTTKHRPNDSKLVLRRAAEVTGQTCSMSPDIQALWVEARSGRLGRPFMVGPKVPPQRVAALRNFFMTMVRDPKFLAEAKSLKSTSTRCQAKICRP